MDLKKWLNLPKNNPIEFENNVEWLQKMHSMVSEYKVPNYLGARIPVPSGLNIPAWRSILICLSLPIIWNLDFQ